ncbi:hypothetical protein J4206_05040 [Candidatus Woesearchaeota archaeon]|nr:hypothetical protein [Candidatus Woesearchaeota archaeon]
MRNKFVDGKRKNVANKAARNILALLIALFIITIIVQIANADTHSAVVSFEGYAATSSGDTLESDVSDAIKSFRGTSNYRAAGTDPIRGTGKLVDFYNRHQSLIDFFVMFTLFATVALVGLNKVGFGEGGNAMKGMALAVGAALALAALKAGYSPSFFVPFVKNFLFLIIFLVIFLVVKAVIGGEHAGTGTIVVSLILALVVTWIAFNVSNLVIEGDANKFNLANGLGWILSSTPTDTSEDRILSDSEIKGLDAMITEKKNEKARIEKTFFEGEVPEQGFTATQIDTLLTTEKEKEKRTFLKILKTLIEEIKVLEASKEKADAKKRAIDRKAAEEDAKKAKAKPAQPETPAKPTTPKPGPSEPEAPPVKPEEAPKEPAAPETPAPEPNNTPVDAPKPETIDDAISPKGTSAPQPGSAKPTTPAIPRGGFTGTENDL